MAKKIPKNNFVSLVKYGPLAAIDIILINPENKVLLGFRKNQPAMNTWFVPGGCIRKNETIKNAFDRILYDELRLKANFKSAKFLGVYEHFYKNNFSNSKFGTHYIVMPYKIKIKNKISDLPLDQHNKYKWFSLNEIIINKKVHINTKNYINTYL